MNTVVADETFPVEHDAGDLEGELALALAIPSGDYGPRLPAGAPRVCRGCGRAIDPASKRHVCTSCTVRKCRGAETGAACEACGHADRRVLRRLRLVEGMVTACGNCTAIAGRRVLSLAALRAELGAAAA